MKATGFREMQTMHLGSQTSAFQGATLVCTICRISCCSSLSNDARIRREDLHVIVCPSGAVWAYYIKVPYFLVRHCKWLLSRLNKITLGFSFGGSRQSLKVHKVKCIPGDPTIMCLVLFKGSCSPLLLA